MLYLHHFFCPIHYRTHFFPPLAPFLSPAFRKCLPCVVISIAPDLVRPGDVASLMIPLRLPYHRWPRISCALSVLLPEPTASCTLYLHLPHLCVCHAIRCCLRPMVCPTLLLLHRFLTSIVFSSRCFVWFVFYLPVNVPVPSVE